MSKIILSNLFLFFAAMIHCQAKQSNIFPTPDVVTIDAGDSVIFDMFNATYSGSQVTIPVYINSDDPIYAVDFSFKFNNLDMVYDTITLSPAGSTLLAVSYLNPNDSVVRFTSSSLVSIANQTVLAFIHFNLASGQSLDAANMFSLKGYLNGDPCSEAIIPPSTVGLSDLASNWNLSIFPNPATDFLFVEMNKDAVLEVLDVQGKDVLLKQSLSAGIKNQVNIEFLLIGFYLLRIYNEEGVSVKKVFVAN